MRLKQYRLAPGHYQTEYHTIYWMAQRCWQIRDSRNDTIIDEQATLHDALKLALKWDASLNNREAATS